MTDPRFDPAFQRGYSGPAPRLVVRETRGSAVPEAAVALVAPAAITPPPMPPVATALEPDAAVEAEIARDEAQSDAVPQQPPRNPYGLAMLLGGVLLILLGVGMIWNSVMTVPDYSANVVLDPGQQALSTLNYLLPPAFLLSGMLGILGWLVLGALRPSPTSR